MSAKVVWLADRRVVHDIDPEIDLALAIDVAIRDLNEIDRHWGSDLARERLAECRRTLVRALDDF